MLSRHLLRGGHAGQYSQYSIQPGGEPKGPGHDGVLRPLGPHQRLGRLRGLCQHTALYRLHGDDLSAVGADGLIAPAGLDIPGVPVEVVQGDLHRLHLRVLREDLVQHIGGVMEGEGDVPDLALLLPLLHVLKQVCVRMIWRQRIQFTLWSR